MTKVYYIQEKDLNKYNTILKCSCCDNKEVIDFGNVMGKILACDIGKKMVKTGDIWQVENQEQFNNRINKGRE